MIITISGMPGSGKTTVGKLLAEKLGYSFYSMGDLKGSMAMNRGITIYELEEAAKTDPTIDRGVDELQREIGRKEDNVIMESWMGFHFIPHSFKVFLTVDTAIAGERIWKNPRPDEPPMKSADEARRMLEYRFKTFEERMKKYYNINRTDLSQFDLVLDSTNLTPEETTEKILTSLPKNK